MTNKKTIRLTSVSGKEPYWYNRTLAPRKARNVGDTETINHTMLGWLKQAQAWGWLTFEIID